jgi:hypothetical protein
LLKITPNAAASRMSTSAIKSIYDSTQNKEIKKHIFIKIIFFIGLIIMVVKKGFMFGN